MKDIECPYCKKEQDVWLDEYVGEDYFHEMRCEYCEKNFVFQVGIHYIYTSQQADCLNGKECDYKPQTCVPINFTLMECTGCGDKRKPTKEEMEIISYIPFELKALACGSAKVHKVTIDNMQNHINGGSKFLLYPLSSITEAISHNGKDIIPLEQFEDKIIGYGKGKVSLRGLLKDISISQSIDTEFALPLVSRKLLEYNIDVYNLIGRGRAVHKGKVL